MAGVYTPTHRRYTATAAAYSSRDPHRTQTHGVTVVYDSAAAAASAVSPYTMCTRPPPEALSTTIVRYYMCVCI